MNVFDLYAKITMDTSDYEKKLSSAKNSASNVASKIGSGLQGAASIGGSALKTIGNVTTAVVSKAAEVAETVAKVSVAAVGTATAGVVALTKNAVENYAEYEQLVGGVETLFKDSAGVVQAYALNAYQTAGMNANEYMSTVTSFSASLLQSLGNDTAAAAEYAHMAIVDMSDNANKMGSDISLIQNAYNGFAKQNYTMLDNLKLGYGGTKEEMQRLLDDAEKLPGALGRDFDISNYADVVEAIHLVQVEMGIAGTTAAEASGTISGSIASMKASWENLVGALASEDADLDYFIDNFVQSAQTAAGNLLPVIRRSLSGISTLVKGLAPVIAQEVPKLLTETIPELVEAGAEIVVELANAIADNADTIAEQAPKLIEALITSAIEVAGALWDVGVAFVEEIATAIEEDGDQIIQDAFNLLFETLTEGFGMTDETAADIITVLETAWETLEEVFSSVETAIDDVVTAVEESGITWDDVWTTIETAVEDAETVITTAIEAVGAIVAWLVEEVTTEGTTLNTAWETVKTTFSVACTVITTALQLVIDIFNGDWSAAWEDAKLLVEQSSTGMEEIVQTRFGGMALKAYEKGYQVGLDLRENLEQAKQWATEKLEAIKNKFSEKMEAARQKVSEVIEKIKGYFNFSWSLPKLKLPHLSVSGSFSLNPPSVPSFSIAWYKKAMDNAMILNGATIFGAYGNTLLGGGEAGPEVVSGADTLMNMIQKASSYGQERMVALMDEMVDLMADYFPEIIQGMERDVVLDDGTLVGRITPAIDAELGKIYRRKNR